MVRATSRLEAVAMSPSKAAEPMTKPSVLEPARR